VGFSHSPLSEGEFLSAVVERSQCGLLLDVNNAYVNSVNLGLDLEAFLASLPADSVQEIHLAGHSRRRTRAGELLIDDHGSEVCDDVWQLYDRALERFGPVPTLIEWDTDVPSLEQLVGEAVQAQRRLGACRSAAA
jgi:hypothetical protein